MAGEVLKILDDILTDKDISQIRSNVATVKALGEMCDNVTVTIAAHCERLLFARETLMTCNLKAAVLRGQDCERIAELESRFMPRCEVCGYNRDDAALHCDHHLCSGEIPETPETLRAEAAEREVDDMKVLIEGLRNSHRRERDELKRDRDVLVAAMRTLWTDVYHTCRKSESRAEARERSIGVMLFDSGLDRETFDRLNILNIAAAAKGQK